MTDNTIKGTTRDVECPYYSCERNGHIICEFATFKPPDNYSRWEFVKSRCYGCYKECEFYKLLDRYYQRKYPSWKPDSKP